MKLELNEQEVNVLRTLLDAAVRHLGVQAADAVAHFDKRLTNPEAQPEEAVEEIEN